MQFKVLFILLFCVPLPTLAQTSASVDSSINSIETNLHKNRSKQIDHLRTYLSDSSTYKRLNSLTYKYVVIQTSGYGKRFFVKEIYYAHADSVPILIYEDNQLQASPYYSYCKNYNEIMKLQENNWGISKREFKFVQSYRHGCLRPGRLWAHRIVKRKLKKYEVSVYMDKSIGTIKTQTIIPRRFHPFIIKMSGGKF